MTLPPEMPFTLKELGNTYVDADDRYVVSLIVGYSDEHVNSPEQAAAAALDLTRDDGSADTHWYVYDRVTRTLHLIEQGDAERYAPVP